MHHGKLNEIYTVTRYFSADQMKEMGGACGTYGGEKEVHTEF
jgi:hypothetical protein